MLKWLKGKKTYIVAAVGIIGAAVGYITGELTVAQTIEAILVALGGMSLRAGISNINNNKETK